MAEGNVEEESAPLTKESGAGGYKNSSGYIQEEFLKELRGIRGRKMYREMMDNDAIIGAMMYAITSIIRAADWTLEPAEADASGQYSEWLENVIYTMPDITWDQVIEDALSMLGYGFAVQEVVIRKMDDGTIGLKKLAPRSQETIETWDIDEENDNVKGLYQRPPNKFGDVYLPLTKCIHYKTNFARGNPEGRSMLRNAYKSYHFIKVTQISEAIGAERDLTGLPVLFAPDSWLKQTGNKDIAKRIVSDIKFNEQGGVVLPSDCFPSSDGGQSNTRKWDLKLLASEGGGSKVDTDKIIKRHSADMARTLLADFIMLGTDGKGSYALSSDKTDLFVRAVEGILENIGQTLDRQLISLLWTLNGFPEEMKPCFRAGRISPIDLKVMGEFVDRLTTAGIPLNDEATETFLRDISGLPPTPSDGERVPLDDAADDEDPTEDDPVKTAEKSRFKKVLNRIFRKR